MAEILENLNQGTQAGSEEQETVASYLKKRKGDKIKIYNEGGYDEEEQKNSLNFMSNR
jgi:hypothetical protein